MLKQTKLYKISHVYNSDLPFTVDNALVVLGTNDYFCERNKSYIVDKSIIYKQQNHYFVREKLHNRIYGWTLTSFFGETKFLLNH